MTLRHRIQKLEKLLDVGQPSPVEMQRYGLEPDFGIVLRALLGVCTDVFAFGPQHRGRIRGLFSAMPWQAPINNDVLDFLVGYVTELLSLSPEDRRQYLDTRHPLPTSHHDSAEEEMEPAAVLPEDHHRNGSQADWDETTDPRDKGEYGNGKCD